MTTTKSKTIEFLAIHYNGYYSDDYPKQLLRNETGSIVHALPEEDYELLKRYQHHVNINVIEFVSSETVLSKLNECKVLFEKDRLELEKLEQKRRKQKEKSEADKIERLQRQLEKLKGQKQPL